MIGDYLVGGHTQLLWPATIQWYGIGLKITSLTGILLEWTFFLTSFTIMFKTKDVWALFKRHPSNLLLAIPIFAVLLPILVSFPLSVPLALIIPHLIYVAIFTFSIFIDSRAMLMKTQR